VITIKFPGMTLIFNGAFILAEYKLMCSIDTGNQTFVSLQACSVKLAHAVQHSEQRHLHRCGGSL